MERPKGTAVLLSLYAFCFLSGVQAQANNESGRNLEDCGVTIKLGAVRITNRTVELRCEIKNDTEENIWIYAEAPREPTSVDIPETHALCFMDLKDETLVILRRAKVPYPPGGVWGGWPSVPYARLRAGHSRPQVLSIRLPVINWSHAERGMIQATYRGIETVRRLAFEVGYYTTADLDSLKPASPFRFQSIRFDESGEVVFVLDMISQGGWKDERGVRLTVDGLTIPYKRWLHWSEVGEQIPGPQLTPSQALEDLFYGFSLSFEEYRYAQCLFSVDGDLLGGTARRIADTYIQVAEGKLDPARLTERLNGIMSTSDREKLLRELQAKQAAVDQKKQARMGDLLAEAKRHDSQAEGRKALALLREVLTIDPSHQEAFDLMRKIGRYYQGEVITNRIGMELAWIPGGQFLMGSNKDASYRQQHEVRISRGFWMGVREVTQAQYEAIMGHNPSRLFKGDAMAVSLLSWHDATEFCRRLSQKEGRTYRLPTEAEWEYACRAGTSTDYWWGDDEQADPSKANAFGLYDMHGNVGEWCQDLFGLLYYIVGPELDPQGPNEPTPGEVEARIIRGWGTTNKFLRVRDRQCSSYARSGLPSEETRNHVGFRVVLDED